MYIVNAILIDILWFSCGRKFLLSFFFGFLFEIF